MRVTLFEAGLLHAKKLLVVEEFAVRFLRYLSYSLGGAWSPSIVDDASGASSC